MPVIEVEHLVKRYKKAKEPAVKDVSFSVEEGEFFAFLGPNGAGKTTTISILTTTLSKTAGRVRIGGYDLDTQERQVRRAIGIIFQRPSLDLTLTAEENIRIHSCLYGVYPYRPTFGSMPAAYRRQVEELAEVVGLGEALRRPVRKLSGGMQRKLEVIRSLMHTPRVLFLDEPTSGLDAVARRNLWDYLNQVRRDHGTTVFLTTHYIDEAEDADTVCLINSGLVGLCCPPQEMKRRLGANRLEDAYVDYLSQETGEMGTVPISGGPEIGTVPISAGSRREVAA
ncbi:MAG: ABC transporter ATP-binding protein [Bifidobacteriaceae bacterium]|jgi:ABC-2 type transport system ATP-binding protein|nr:ABC transporter ATP-binding protein [Bifidobacteriaceae bacterium]